jgi:hypothetical protein
VCVFCFVFFLEGGGGFPLPFYFLPYFDLRLLIISLVSVKLSYRLYSLSIHVKDTSMDCPFLISPSVLADVYYILNFSGTNKIHTWPLGRDVLSTSCIQKVAPSK